MRNRMNLVKAAALLLPLSACAGQQGWNPPVGSIYSGAAGINPSTQVNITDAPRPGPKTGQSCAQGVLGVAAWGDMSLDAAKKAGGIARVDSLDYKVMDILGVVYQRRCTQITGE
jgi:hypothetical protein